jgi:hypothetical protein
MSAAFQAGARRVILVCELNPLRRTMLARRCSPGVRPFLHLSGVSERGEPGGTSPGIGENQPRWSFRADVDRDESIHRPGWLPEQTRRRVSSLRPTNPAGPGQTRPDQPTARRRYAAPGPPVRPRPGGLSPLSPGTTAVIKGRNMSENIPGVDLSFQCHSHGFVLCPAIRRLSLPGHPVPATA